MSKRSDFCLFEFLSKVHKNNSKFASDHGESFFDSLRDVQSPYVTLLKCSDSRVQMDLFEHAAQGQVFVVRNIGNQIETSIGSVDFGIRVLKTPVLFILGHSGCRAVQGALKAEDGFSESIKRELALMRINLDAAHDPVKQNIHNQVAFAMKKYADLLLSSSLNIIGAIYDFRDDYGYGKGKIVFVNLNGISSYDTLIHSFGDKFRGLPFSN